MVEGGHRIAAAGDGKQGTRCCQPCRRAGRRIGAGIKGRRLEGAKGAGLTLPLAEAHRRIMEQAEQLGLGDQDNSVILEVLRRQ